VVYVICWLLTVSKVILRVWLIYRWSVPLFWSVSNGRKNWPSDPWKVAVSRRCVYFARMVGGMRRRNVRRVYALITETAGLFRPMTKAFTQPTNLRAGHIHVCVCVSHRGY
jgi:hypothetical protein